jgi:hypothetical protein
MSDRHVPPPGADEAVRQAAHAYLVAVQEAIGTSHTTSIVKIAIFGIVQVAEQFGVSATEMLFTLRDVEAHMRGGKR